MYHIALANQSEKDITIIAYNIMEAKIILTHGHFEHMQFGFEITQGISCCVLKRFKNGS